jgi:hypothetical protein
MPKTKEEIVSSESNTMKIRLESFPEIFILSNANMKYLSPDLITMRATMPDNSYDMWLRFHNSIKEGDIHFSEVDKFWFREAYDGGHKVYSLVHSDDFRITIKSIDKVKHSCDIYFQGHLQSGSSAPKLWATGKINLQGE